MTHSLGKMMSESIPTPAFPVPAVQGQNGEWQHGTEFGMELRDYFAAAALQGFLANTRIKTRFEANDDANYCYRLADAMLAARERKS